MDLKVIASTFAVVFLAELADKTQLATFGLAAGNASKWSVFLGSAFALVASSAIAVLVAGALTRVVPPSLLMRGAAVLLVVLGVITFFSAGRVSSAGEAEEPRAEPTASAAAQADGGASGAVHKTPERRA